MAALFSADYQLLWTAVLALGLFFPVRKLIWVLYVRRAQKTADVDDAEQARLRKRAGVTAALLCLVFAFFYTAHLLGDGQPGAGL